MTIFGYNTDIRHGDTVFHVQTEARENELTMQSAVFVRGRCIGKHTVSYAGDAESPDFDEHYIHRLVTQQHRFVLNTIREGRLAELLSTQSTGVPAPHLPADQASATATPAPTSQSKPVPAPQSTEKLSVEWVPDHLIWGEGKAHLRFRVKLGAEPVTGARVISRVDFAGSQPAYGEGTSDSRGEADVVCAMQNGAAPSADGCTVLVKVTAGSQSVTRKFRLQRG